MAYYRGDYYRGDYYQGGFLGSIASGLGKLVGIGVKSTPVGGAIKGAYEIGKGIGGLVYKPPPVVVPDTPEQTAADERRVNIAHSQQRAYAKKTGTGAPTPMLSDAEKKMVTQGPVGMPSGGGNRGYHWSARRQKWVKNRRMHVTNPKALRRAIRRARGFAKMARRVLSFPISKPPKGRALFKARRGKR